MKVALTGLQLHVRNLLASRFLCMAQLLPRSLELLGLHHQRKQQGQESKEAENRISHATDEITERAPFVRIRARAIRAKVQPIEEECTEKDACCGSANEGDPPEETIERESTYALSEWRAAHEVNDAAQVMT